MATPPIPDDVLKHNAAIYAKLGMQKASIYLNLNYTTLESRIQEAIRRGFLEKKVGRVRPEIEGRRHIDIQNGHVLIGSDAHYYPGIVSTAHRAFVQMCRDINPTAVIMNGDIFDGARVSRHARIGWDNKPTVKQELETVDTRLAEVREAAGTKNLYWTLGNHDARFETFLAAAAPEFEGVQGFTLKDRYPEWAPCWSVWISDNTVVKHRFKSGIHAPHNNTMWAGKSMVTGHLHSLKVQPISDYNGTRYGVDCGTLAQPYGPQFNDYCEDSPVSWRSGFVLLTYHKGKLLWPQVIAVHDEENGEVEMGTKVFQV